MSPNHLHLKPNFAAFLLLAATSLSGCGSGDGVSETKIVGGFEVPDSQQDAIMWSTVALTTDSARPGSPDSTALIDKAQSFCTGTIINKRTIVTAAHCLQQFDPETHQTLPDLILDSHEKFVVYFGNKVERAGKWIRAKKVIPHPEWSPGETLSASPEKAANDIGVVILSAEIPDSHRPVAIADHATRLDPAKDVRLAGFGVTLNRAQNDTGILRQVTTALTSEDGKIKRFTVGQFFRGACAGDSGGPAYVHVNGEYQLAGATSTGAEFLGTCLGLINNYTDVRYYKYWISSISVEETGLSL